MYSAKCAKWETFFKIRKYILAGSSSCLSVCHRKHIILQSSSRCEESRVLRHRNTFRHKKTNSSRNLPHGTPLPTLRRAYVLDCSMTILFSLSSSPSPVPVRLNQRAATNHRHLRDASGAAPSFGLSCSLLEKLSPQFVSPAPEDPQIPYTSVSITMQLVGNACANQAHAL